MSTLLQQTKAPVEPEYGTAGVYQIRNLHNGKIYVGSSAHLNKREWTHFDDLKKGHHHNRILQRAYAKYGRCGLAFEVLINCHPDMCLWYEQQFLDQWQPEYNIVMVAGRPEPARGPGSRPWQIGNQHALGNKSRLGLSHSNETKHKISKAQMGNKSRLGMKTSEETKRKISKALLGRKHSYKALKRISLRSGSRKLSPSDVQEIRRRLSNGDLQKDIAFTFGVSPPLISMINTGRRNAYV